MTHIKNPYNMDLVRRYETGTIVVYSSVGHLARYLEDGERPILHLTQKQLQAMMMLDAAANPADDPTDTFRLLAEACIDGVGASWHYPEFKEYRLAAEYDARRDPSESDEYENDF